MNNYNINIDLLKVTGARVMEAAGVRGPERGVFIPFGNVAGTVNDIRGEATLSLTAFEQPYKIRGQSHLIKVRLPQDVRELLTPEQMRQEPWIGNMKQWTKP